MPARKSQHNLAQVPPGATNERALFAVRTATCHQLIGDMESRNAAKASALPIRLIPIETVCEMLGLKRSATQAMVAAGVLPKPIKFGASRRAAARWVEREIFEFIMKKAAERNLIEASCRDKEVAE